MLDCRKCSVSTNDCDCKKDLEKALDLISSYIPHSFVEEIEEIIEDGLEECEDFTEEK